MQPPEESTSSFPSNSKFVITAGEILPDGSILDLVCREDQTTALVHYGGQEIVELASLERDGIIYFPLQLDARLRAAVKLPAGTAMYESIHKLFCDLQNCFTRHGFQDEAAGWGALFVLASWAPEVFSQAPTLLVLSELQIAAAFFLLLNALCRRALLCTRLSHGLPFYVRPTLLVMASRMSATARETWRASSVRGTWSVLSSGRVQDCSGVRALLVDSERIEGWAAEEWCVPLPTASQIVLPTDLELATMARDFQPKLLRFRLTRLVGRSQLSTPTQQGSTIPRQLLTLVGGDPYTVDAMAPLLEHQARDFAERNRRDPHRVVVECLWQPAHDAEDISVGELTRRLNTMLRIRDEITIYDEREVGWILRRLGIERQRTENGMVVRFDTDLRHKVHGLMRKFGLDLLKMNACADCAGK